MSLLQKMAFWRGLKSPKIAIKAKKIHFCIFFLKKYGDFLSAKNALWGRMKTPKIAPESKNANFFKVWDNDTMIQPGEKKGQTDVSSTLKRFYDNYSVFWENHKFWISITSLTTFLGFLYRNPVEELKKSKNLDFLRNRCSGRKTFLGPT